MKRSGLRPTLFMRRGEVKRANKVPTMKMLAQNAAREAGAA